jgi:hypothetical protein
MAMVRANVEQTGKGKYSDVFARLYTLLGLAE